MEGKQDPGASRGLVNVAITWFNETMKSSWWFVGVIVLILAASALLRFNSLSTPTDQIFDEVYFPVFANNYITHTDFYDSHPPLGKLIIAAGIVATDNTPFGWRWINAVTGCLVIIVAGGYTWSLTRSKRAVLIALILFAIEPMALVESRVGLINIYLVLFSLLGLWSFWEWWKQGETNGWLLIATTVFLSAASAVKWIGIFATIGVFLFWLSTRLIKNAKPTSLRPIHYLIAICLFVLVYIATFLPDLAFRELYPVWSDKAIKYLTWWHTSSFHYHAGLTATHPYGSDWWTWALMIRPIWLYYQVVTPGTIRGIIEIGNVVTWIGGLFFIVQCAIKAWQSKQRTIQYRNGYLLLTYFVLYLPWIAISRVKFIYHYFPAALILLIISAIMLDEAWAENPAHKYWIIAYLMVASAFFIYFLPLLMGWPISEAFYRQHMWLKSWI